jgi:putative nucleotidyltransferase with HDIG domain
MKIEKMNREEAQNLLKENLKEKNLIKHSLAVESAMRGLAEYLGEDTEEWGICGLLHDIDYEEVKDDIKKHSQKGAEKLSKLGFSQNICYSVLTHNEVHGIAPQTKMAKALFCVDPLTGLIVASVLVLPSKKIKDLETENVLKRFKEKAFAKGANREIIAKCKEYLNLSLKEFIDIVLSSMKGISEELGL